MHQYRNRNDYYIATNINQNIVAFQLTPEGRKRLQEAGILPGQTFTRAILLDLYRSGDAFTGGSGAGEIIDERRGELDLTNDSVSEKMFPSCARCISLKDLHLIEFKGRDHHASILCTACRSTNKRLIDTSIPLPLVSGETLKRLMAIKGIEKTDTSVVAYKKLLETEFEHKWDAKYNKKKKNRKQKQATPADTDDKKQGRLI